MADIEQNVPLPEEIIVKAVLEHGREGYAVPVSNALRRILDGTSSERIAMMQLGMDALDSATERGAIKSIPCALSEELLERFFEYCEEMNLRAELLVVGAMMLELGMDELPTDLPDFSDVCGMQGDPG